MFDDFLCDVKSRAEIDYTQSRLGVAFKNEIVAGRLPHFGHRGVDVGAQAAIWEELRRARAAGLAVLLISADLDELIGLSDSLLVMFRGEITAHLDPSEATPEQLGMYMAGERQEVGA